MTTAPMQSIRRFRALTGLLGLFCLALALWPLGGNAQTVSTQTVQTSADKPALAKATGNNPQTTAAEAEKPTATKPATENPDVSETLARANRTLESLRKSVLDAAKVIKSPNATIDQLIKQKSTLDALQVKIVSAQKQLDKPIEDFSAKLAELGPAPKKGETEAKAIAEKRKQLATIAAELKAAQKKFDLLELEASQIGDLASNLQKQAFVQRVLEPQSSIFLPKLWVEFLPTLGDLTRRGTSLMLGWINKPAAADKWSGGAAFDTALFLNLITLLFIWYLWRKMANPPVRVGPADNLRRLWRALGSTVAVALVCLVAAVLSELLLKNANISDLRVFRTNGIVSVSIGVIAVMATLLRGILAPANNQWRLTNRSDDAAQTLNRVGFLIVLVFGIDNGLTVFADVVFLPLAFVVGIHAITSILLIIFFSMLITTARNARPLQSEDAREPGRYFYFDWAGNIFLLAWAIVIIAILALVLGFVSFAHFLLTKTVITASVIAGLYLLHNLVDALVSTATKPHSTIGRTLRHKMGLQDQMIQRVGLTLSTITDFAVIIVGLPIILSLWAITWIDLSGLASKAFFGFKIGDITIEPSRIMLAIVMLAVGIIMVRLITAWLNRRILDRTHLDSGVKNSISTGATYAGFLLVAGFSLSAAGLDFSKLAIVAGALSVGIGFGLQSVVSNFVSGLILLAERPIRIGDWIEVGAGEGTVKKINVRSTEILTFDRCSVIIPNSSFISDPVKNWSHGSSVGRIKVNVGVGYDSDPEEVEKILLKCANANENIVPSPAPKVMFMDFGASSLDFQLRVFLRDIGDCTVVGSQLRFAIFTALKDAGIEIPFPQRDINIRDADKLAQSFQTAQEPAQASSARKKPVKK